MLHAEQPEPAVQLAPTITKVAGGGSNPVNGGPALSAQVAQVHGVAIDSAGNIYLSSYTKNQIWKVDTAGNISVFAGTGVAGYSGDSGPAALATLRNPDGLAIDAAGNLYIADTNNQAIRKIDASGTITTIAGGAFGNTGDGGPATLAKLAQPGSVAVDGSGNIYIADTGNQEIRKIDAATNNISTVAGSAALGFGYTGDGGLATAAKLTSPRGLAVDANGNIFIADTSNNVIRKVDTAGIITTVAGNGTAGFTGDGGLATAAELDLPYDVIVDAKGNLYISDTYNNEIRKVDRAGVITAFVGTGSTGYPGEGVVAHGQQIGSPFQMAFDVAGNFYFSNLGDAMIDKIALSNYATMPPTNIGVIINQPVLLQITRDTVLQSIQLRPDYQGFLAGSPEFAVGPSIDCIADGVTVTPAGSFCTVNVTYSPGFPGQRSAPLVVTDSSYNQYTFGLTGIATGPLVGFSPASIAASLPLNSVGGSTAPGGVAVDSAENYFIADMEGQQILTGRVSSSTDTLTVAHTGGYTLSEPIAVATDPAGNLYIADYNEPYVLKVTSGGATATSLTGGFTLANASGLAVDKDGNVYVADKSNNRVVEITASGSGIVINTGSFVLSSPEGVAVDTDGNIYIADTFNNRVVKVATNGAASLVSTGELSLGRAGGVAVDAAGDLYIADMSNGNILEVPATGSPFYVDLQTLPHSDIAGIAVDSFGNLFYSDNSSKSINVIGPALGVPTLKFADTKAGTTNTDGPKTVRIQNLGNAPLNFLPLPPPLANPAYPTQFPQNDIDTNLCGGGTTLTAGAICDVSASFHPSAAGAISDQLVLRNNSQNNPSATQNIQVAGTGLLSVDHFTVTNAPSTETAGTSFNITVTAADSAGAAAPGYTGTVQFTSSDAKAVLPESYTFTSADAGVHVFTVTLKTAGSQTITATDSVSSTATGAASVSVTPDAASSFTLQSGDLQSQSIGGYLQSLEVRLADQYDNPISGTAVTFTVPASGASTTRGTLIENTESDGVAYYYANANAIAGSYQIVATVSGIDTQLVFHLTNTAGTTATVVSANSDSGVYGQTVVLTATVTPNNSVRPALAGGGIVRAMNTVVASPMRSDGPTLGPATGTVSFFDGTRLLGTVALGSAGGVSPNLSGIHANIPPISTGTPATAALTVTAPLGGTHSYTATYNGDSNFVSSTSTVPVSFLVTPATVVLAGPATQPVNANPGQTSTISVTVTPQASGAAIVLPTGTVTYRIGEGDMQTATVTNGKADLNVPSTLTQGNYTVSMTYSGDVNYQAVTTPVTIALVEQTPDYSLTANPESLTLKAGQTGNVVFTFAPVGGYKGTVNLSCSGLPVGVTCTFVPPSFTADGSNKVQTSQLTIVTQGPNHGTVAGNDASNNNSHIVAASIFFLPGMLFGTFLIWERKKLPIRTKQLLLMLVMVTTISGMIGCGTGPRTVPGSNTVTVTASASASGAAGDAASHKATFTLVIVE